MKTKRIENLIINDSSIRNSIYDAILFLIETSNELARSLRTVDELSLGDDIRNDIEGRIQYMQTIIKPYDINTLEKTVDGIYHSFDKMEEEKEKLNLHKQDVKACMEIERALYDLTDAANFFAPFESLEKFINWCVKSDDSLDELYSNFTFCIKKRLNREKQESEQVNRTTKLIVDVIAKCRSLWRRIDNKNANFTRVVFFNKQINEGVCEIFGKNIIKELFAEVNKRYTINSRQSTSFYLNLPLYLKERLDLEFETVGDGEIFKMLQQNYFRVQNGEQLSFVQEEETEELSFVEESLNEELAKIYKIVMMAYENMKKGNTLDDSSSSPKNGSHKHKSLFNTFKGRKK